MLNSVAHQTGVRRSPTEIPLKQRWATLQAKTLLEKHREVFNALVVAMAERATVEDCRAAIELHRSHVIAQ